MTLYLEYLGKCLLSESFYKDFHKVSSSPHLSAARQIENLICTNRESLLGSSAWRADFLKELQARPFYMSKRSSPGSYFYDCGAGSSGWDEERCQACGRTSQCPDHQVILFGPSYIAGKAWESHWVDYIPKVLFVSSELKSAANTPLNSVTAKTSCSGRSSGSRNKQFKAFSAAEEKEAKRRLSLSPAKENRLNKKGKNSIILSDDSDEENKDLIDLTETENVLVREEQKPISNSGISSSDGDESEGSDEEGDKSVNSSPKKQKKKLEWWEKKLPRQLNSEPETKWQLSL